MCRKLVFALIMLLAGCSSIPETPKIITTEVKIPVPKPCEVNIGNRPENLLNRLTKNSSIEEIVKTLIAQRKLEIAYIQRLENAIEFCKKPFNEEVPNDSTN